MSAQALVRTDLGVDGMTCAACANRVQQHLDGLDAVGDAHVNFATGRATVRHDGSVDAATLAAQIETLGYLVIDSDERDLAAGRREADLTRRVVFALALAIPAMAVAMIDALSFDGSKCCLLYTSPSPRDKRQSRMPSSA